MQASISEALGPPAAPATGAIFWYKADAGVTKDGSNLVSGWADQTANHYDVAALGALPTNKPTWVAAAINGLPALDWGHTIVNDAATAKSLQRNILAGDPAPIKLLGARSYFAVIKPTTSADSSRVGGNVVSLDSSGGALIGQMMQVVGVQEGMYDGFGHYYQLNAVVDYANTAIQADWSWAGSATPDVIGVNVNGVNRPGILQPGGTHMTALNNCFRINLGFEAGAAYTGWTFSGLIAEVLCYAGTDPAIAAVTRAYLKGKYGL